MSPNTRKIPFFRPYIRGREIRAVKSVLRSGWLTTGPGSRRFEDEFAAFLGSDPSTPRDGLRALAVNSATSGLHLALEAAGVGPGDLVAVPTMTFTATAEVVRYLGADPVFVDSSPSTWNMDPSALAGISDRLTSEGRSLKAVIVVHLAGLPCDMEAIRRALPSPPPVIIEDAAHSFPSRTPGGMAGTLGDIGVFSFYATKTITTGEGGMVVTRHPEYAGRMETMRLHGIDRNVWNRYTSGANERSWEYDVAAAGYKYNMTDMAAALGSVQLGRADRLLEMRTGIAEAYDRALESIPCLQAPPSGEGHAHHLYIASAGSEEERDRFISRLAIAGIGVSVHFIPLHRLTFWRDLYNLNAGDFPVADELASRNFSLPLWPGMTRRQVSRVINVLHEACDG